MHCAIKIKEKLRVLNKKMNALITKDLEGMGLTFPQIAVIKSTAQGAKTVGQISQAVGLSNSTVSGIIDRLERDGFVERKRCEEDRRVVRIQHTSKVEEVRKQVPVFRDEYYIQLFEDIPEEELEQIYTSLCILTTQLEKKGEGKP